MYEFLEISNLEKHYAENPDSVIFAFMAFRNLEQGNPEKALAICEDGVRKHPEYPFGHFVLGLCHYHLKDYSKAKAHLEITTAFDDKNPQAWKLLGEINEHLDLPILADECNLKYYLLDSFNPDALEKYQKGEIIDFDVFKKENDYDFTPPAKSSAEEQSVAENVEKKTETSSFDEQSEEAKESPISVKNDSFMERMTRDISETDQNEKKEIVSEDRRTDETHEKKEETAEYSPTETPEFDLNKSNSDDASELNLDDEIRRGFEDTSSEGSDELLDFRSVVKDIISETDDYSDDSTEEESSHQENVAEEETVPEMITPEEDMEVSKLGRPPILTPTIGEIYIAQGRFKEAIDVFEQLLEKEPDNQKYQKKIADIRSIIEKQNT